VSYLSSKSFPSDRGSPCLIAEHRTYECVVRGDALENYVVLSVERKGKERRERERETEKLDREGEEDKED